ncbi:WD repeat and coiled-coil-containing protein-like isoform X1 [Ptychodera flava]|uniref:WD repeat and coiled-coil-containing protein-like isoform X1 n=1 Tax=Ptychodera flava TaxID=63121 RepID=UPI00396A055F
MELGRVKLSRTKINSLFQAIHPTHGLAWTNGAALNLTPISYFKGKLVGEKTVKLKDFGSDDVIGACWSPHRGASYLAVQCVNKTIIWKVTGSTADTKLNFITEITGKALSKGVLWHPKLPIVCVLTKSDVKVINVESSVCETLHQGSDITGGVWSSDSKKLIISEGSSLLTFDFNDIETSLTERQHSVWQVPGLDAPIGCIVAIDDDQLLVTTGLPLDRVVTNTQEDMFDVPNSLQPSSVDAAGNSVDAGTGNVNTLDFDVSGKGPIDLTSLVAANKQSAGGQSVKRELLDERPTKQIKDDNILDIMHVKRDTDKDLSLLKLKRNTCQVQDASRLLLISMKDETPDIVSNVTIAGILEPDLISYQMMNKTIAVSSNAQSKIQIFIISEKEIKKIEDLDLGRDGRPKGLCSTLDGKDLLYVVGKQVQGNSLFPPSSQMTEYDLSFRYHSMEIVTMPPAMIPIRDPYQDCDGEFMEQPYHHPGRDEVDSGPHAGLSTGPYPTLYKAGFVHFLHNYNGNTVKKTFILENGLVRLQAIKEAFQLATVEIVLGNAMIVLSADKEGFVPVTFEHNKTWTVVGRKIQK